MLPQWSASPSPRGVDPALFFADNSDNRPQARHRASEAASQAQVGSASLRILVIEDNIDAADTLGEYLEISGHSVRVAYSGPDGVHLAAEFLPDVVLCDIGLPGMDGWSVARQIRSAPATANARLIAITGYGTDEDRRTSTEVGFEAHLTKPVDIRVLDQLLGL